MQVIENDSDPLPCLTSTGQHFQFQCSSLMLNEFQQEYDVYTSSCEFSFDVGLFLFLPKAMWKVFGHISRPIFNRPRDNGVDGHAPAFAQYLVLFTERSLPCLILFTFFWAKRITTWHIMSTCQLPNRGSMILAATKTLHSLGGNAMSLRAVLPCICAALAACLPERMSSKWSG